MSTLPDAPTDYMLTEEEIVEFDDLLESRSPKRGRSMERLEEEVRDETQNKTKETEFRPQVTKSPPLWGLLAFLLFLRPAYGVRIGPQPPNAPSPDSPRPHAWRYVWPQDNVAPDVDPAEDDEPEGYIIMEQMRNLNKEPTSTKVGVHTWVSGQMPTCARHRPEDGCARDSSPAHGRRPSSTRHGHGVFNGCQ